MLGMAIRGFLMHSTMLVGVEAKRMWSVETFLEDSGTLEARVFNESDTPPANAHGASPAKLIAPGAKPSSRAKEDRNAMVTGMLRQVVKRARSLDQEGDHVANFSIEVLPDRNGKLRVDIAQISLPSGKDMLMRYLGKLDDCLENHFTLKKSEISKSGADFFWSEGRDQRFILKTMPSESEFQVLSTLPSMKEHFRRVDNDILKTSVNPVLLSFASVDGPVGIHRRFWALMPAESVSMIEGKRSVIMRGNEVVTWEVKLDEHDSVKAMFDVKPEPILSAQRPAFFRYLEEVTEGRGLGFGWKNHNGLQKVVQNDLKFLDGNHFVDYSIFAMFQLGNVRRSDTHVAWTDVIDGMQIAFPRCAWQVILRDPGDYSDREYGYGKVTQIPVGFMCVAVIDFLMDLTKLSRFKQLENKALGNKSKYVGKWDEWGEKVKELFLCMTYPCAKANGESPRMYAPLQLQPELREEGESISIKHVNGCKKYRDHFKNKEYKNCKSFSDEERLAGARNRV